LPGNIVHGTKGTFVKSKADIQEAELQAGKIPGSKDWGVEPDKEKGLLHTEKEGKIIREHLPTLNGDYMEYYEGMYQALRNNAPVPVTGAEGMKVIKIIEAALESNRYKKVIQL
jgi:predicted dehydrogenase